MTKQICFVNLFYFNPLSSTLNYLKNETGIWKFTRIGNIRTWPVLTNKSYSESGNGSYDLLVPFLYNPRMKPMQSTNWSHRSRPSWWADAFLLTNNNTPNANIIHKFTSRRLVTVNVIKRERHGQFRNSEKRWNPYQVLLFNKNRFATGVNALARRVYKATR